MTPYRFIRAFVLWFALLYTIFIALYAFVLPLFANRWLTDPN